MRAQELRQKYLDFFKTKEHAIIPSASLIPENDPTTLFITAGMQPLVPYFTGEKHPLGKRVVNVQKCIRTDDIDEVGDFTHHTFFEMLGNWSFGDYFKKEAIEWSWQFLTSPDWLGLDKNRIAVSVFEGDKDAPFDQEAFDKWVELGVPVSRIAKLSKKENWWGPAGNTGPCGPDTEMFYWVGDPSEVPAGFNDDNDLWVEIWNNVFIQFYKDDNGGFEDLDQKSVDTGMGLERMVAVMNGLDDDYATELFANVISKIGYLSGKSYESGEEIRNSMRIIADHVKASVFITGDDNGIAPSNTDQGYIVRRLIRRAIRHGFKLGIDKESWVKEIAKVVIYDYEGLYPEISENANFIISSLEEEEGKFKATLEKGLKEISSIISGLEAENKKEINGKDAFYLYQSYGFPIEMTEELAKEKGFLVDEKGFDAEFRKHQELSRTAATGKFKGGMADDKEETTKLHTAAHLLLAALRRVLGDQVLQKGSNITSERLRFDFSHPEKMTEEQKREVEEIVNNAISKDLKVSCEEMPLDEAKENGAVASFEGKYGDVVKVYSIGEGDDLISYEICGGPHVESIGDLGSFRIKKEQSSSAGVRRIKAVLE